ncbi:LysR family transcriptional regulator [Azospirillum thiophilum]|uniref:LysR family transcriptional regulator n=1 Tax=Azospirillum thiophilum TaxID=528244 RepID=A0AAC8W3Y8_9PROT|nr:LysR family transcriptional regulator [Azospirillum thiophilum]ALG74668.1 LysR family transcriptional regulator [Azospirillum thiophilum]KJR61844.1 LysR family transcriptional regulator [Azospirillum thiophilum]
MNGDLLPIGSDRIALLETFIRIVDSGSLSAAAAQLGSTQPTISRRLQQLERLLGVRLLQRSTHRMKLTEDGARCYERAKDLLDGWQMLESDVRGADDQPSGHLRVVAPHAFGQQQLIGPLADYLRRYPRMTVEWLLHDRMPDFIAEGIDCAIRVGEIGDPSVIALRLAEVPRIAVAAPALLAGRPVPSHPSELAELPWLALRTFYRDEVTLTHAGTGEIARFPIRPRLSTDGLQAVRNAAIEGLGAAIGSHWAMVEDLAAGRLLHLAPDWQAAALPVNLVYPPARFQPARLRRFIEVMRRAVPVAFGTVQAP